MTGILQPSSISPQALHALMARDGNIILLDVRTPNEFREFHVAGARLMPITELDPSKFMQGISAPVYVFCLHGMRAARAIEKFVQAGFNNCVLVEGGTQAWIDAGLPVKRD